MAASKVALMYLKGLTHRPFTQQALKGGDRIDLGGGHEMEFVTAPNLHWPDTMFSFDHKTGKTCAMCPCGRADLYSLQAVSLPVSPSTATHTRLPSKARLLGLGLSACFSLASKLQAHDGSGCGCGCCGVQSSQRKQGFSWGSGQIWWLPCRGDVHMRCLRPALLCQGALRHAAGRPVAPLQVLLRLPDEAQRALCADGAAQVQGPQLHHHCQWAWPRPAPQPGGACGKVSLSITLCALLCSSQVIVHVGQFLRMSSVQGCTAASWIWQGDKQRRCARYKSWSEKVGKSATSVAVLYASEYGFGDRLSQTLARGITKAEVATEMVDMLSVEPPVCPAFNFAWHRSMLPLAGPALKR